MSALNAVCTNGSLREFWSAPFVEVDLSEQPGPPRQELVQFTGYRATLYPLLVASHVWGVAFVVIPSLFS